MMIAGILIVAALAVGCIAGWISGRHLALKRRALWPAVALVVFSIGLLLTMMDGDTFQRKWAERSWPRVTGEVLHSELTHGTAYSPSISYKYLVADSSYTATSDGRAPGFGGKRRRYDAAEAILHEYTPGSEITVHYNPENPNESTLRPGPDWDVFAQLSLGTMLMMFGVALLVILKMRGRQHLRRSGALRS